MQLPDDSAIFCPRHQSAGVGVSEEHVFCLYDGCSWEEELCWDGSRGQDTPLLCTKVSGHDGDHAATTEEGVCFTWAKPGSAPPNVCTSCGSYVPWGRMRCAGCEERLLQQALVGKDPAVQSEPKCTECGVEMMGQLGKLCKACKSSTRCERCGRSSRGPKYCVKCEEVLRTGSAPSP